MNAHEHLKKSTSFVSRPLSIALVAVSSPTHYTLWNALAVESLAGDLRGLFGDSVEIRVFRVRSNDELDQVSVRIGIERPLVVGVSVECGGVELSLELAKRVVAERQNETPGSVKLVFGGKIPTYFPELFLTRHRSAIVVLGEGELPLRQVIGNWLNPCPENLEQIPNLSFYNEAGEIFQTPLEQPKASELLYAPSLDTVGELVEIGAGTFLTQGSRGCSWSKCTYCTVPSFRHNAKWSPLPWNRTLKHLEGLASLGVREFEFCDDEFMGGRDPEHLDRVAQIATDLKAFGKNCDGIAFRVFLIPHTIYKEADTAGNRAVKETLRLLKDSGLVRVYFGIESGSESQLKRYCRGTPLSDVVGALNVVKDLELGIDSGFIMFDPQVTTDEITENAAFFRRYGLINYNQWPFRPLVANEGAGIGRLLARRGVSPDPEYMCYRYPFKDPGAQVVFDNVDALSSETRSLFYSLKVISKTHFDPRKQTLEARCARELVIQNGLIYLDLIDDLIVALKSKDSDRGISTSVDRARYRIVELVETVSRHLRDELLHDPYGRLRLDVAHHSSGIQLKLSDTSLLQYAT